MSINYAEKLERDFTRQIKYNHIAEYDALGYKGKGITILNAEGASDHRAMTTKVIKDYAPNAAVLECLISVTTFGGVLKSATVTLDGVTLSLEDAIDKYHIKLITRSYAGSSTTATLNYYKDLQKRKGVIFVCSAGNDDYDGVTGIWTKDDTAIAVGALKIKEDGTLERYIYSAIGEELDFMSFLARGVGTSAASPALAALIARLLCRYGDFNQEECVEILKSISIDLGNCNNFGWGLPILPLTDKLEILEEMRRADKVVFKDVEETRWSKAAIDRCIDEGLIVGFEDGTYRPTQSVTREEFATILTRILDKIEGRI